MSRPDPPTDPDVYALVRWDGYRAKHLSHWVWPAAPRFAWRTFCGQQQVLVRAATAEHVCTICASGYANVCAKYDADHTTPPATGV